MTTVGAERPDEVGGPIAGPAAGLAAGLEPDREADAGATGPGVPPARRRRRWPRRVALGVAVVVLLVLAPIAWVQLAGRVDERSLADVPDEPVALVLGAGITAHGQPSPYLRRRLDAAATLYRDGRVTTVLVSGDHSTPYHDEPAVMRTYLLAHGVRDGAIVRDDAGLDTHASCVRAHDVYGVERAVVITQDYHLPRALFTCRHAGIDVVGVGVSAASARPAQSLVWHLREAPASLRAALDALAPRAVPALPGEQPTPIAGG
jgi:vancomycin permeability regulator SanA